MKQKKLSKCIITAGKELLKDLGIEFQETCIERAERTNEILEVKDEKKESKQFVK